MNNPILTFLQETLQRLFTKSPVFFRVWTIFFSALTLVTGVPALLEYFGVTLPPDIAILASKTIAYIALVAAFMSKLTTQSAAVATTTNGTIVKKTDVKALPFTAAQETIKVDLLKKNLPEIKDIPVTNQPK